MPRAAASTEAFKEPVLAFSDSELTLQWQDETTCQTDRMTAFRFVVSREMFNS